MRPLRPFLIATPSRQGTGLLLLMMILIVVDGWSFSKIPPHRPSRVPSPSSRPPTPLHRRRRRRSTPLDASTVTRSKFLQSIIVSTIGVTTMGESHHPAKAAVVVGNPDSLTPPPTTTTTTTTLYQRTAAGMKSSNPISYQLQLPNSSSSSSDSLDSSTTITTSSSSSFQESQKPVKTHLDEVNLISNSIKGYQYGITVDPVRINSLTEFGTPEEVAARVVTAEVNRDGIFEVTLMDDPIMISHNSRVEDASATSGTVAYLLHYLSVGKRGNKHLWNKIIIQNQLLYVLTAQCKEGDYEGLANEMKQTVASFQVG